MKRWMLLGLMTLLPLGASAVADDVVCDYDANKCDAFAHNMDAPFEVAGQKQVRYTLDLRHCGGCIQNYQVTLMGSKRDVPYSTLMVLDQSGRSVGVSDPTHHVVRIGCVPACAVYTVVVTSGVRRTESCILFYSGGM